MRPLSQEWLAVKSILISEINLLSPLLAMVLITDLVGIKPKIPDLYFFEGR